MFLLHRPSPRRIREFLASQEGQPFSYPEVGSSRGEPPSGYAIDHNRVCLGEGVETFERAVAALRHWMMFDLGWVSPGLPDAPIEPGTPVAVLAKHFGFWSLIGCRIVYVIDEPESFGFAYGTLPDHPEMGEERFSVEYHADDRSVWYDILAFSRPRRLIRLVRPIARGLQKRFACDSMNAMRAAVKAAAVSPSYHQRDGGLMPELEIATLAGGCFWCLEAVFDEMEGVSSVESGYMGGKTKNPTYRDVCGGGTGHAEVVQLKFDPAIVSFRDILEVFFAIHDPTTPNRQGNDVGTQYRSAIFYHSPEQKVLAEETIRELTAKRAYSTDIVTEVVPAAEFYRAEDYHQEYFANNPLQPYCQYVVSPKVGKFRAKFAAKRKAAPQGGQ
jgi:peptide-methionine (S)-S-oxide reductase